MPPSRTVTTKRRTPGQTATSFSCEETLLKAIDERAHSLGMNRSQYLAALARKDLVERQPFTLHEKQSGSPPKPPPTEKPVRYSLTHPKRKAS